MRCLPNLISLIRLLLAIPVLIAIRDDDNGRAVFLLVLCLLTDGADGWVARRWGALSEVGKILDPLADKVVAATVALSLFFWRALPAWFLIAILLRDLLIVVGGAWMRRRTGLVPTANRVGKVTLNVLIAVLLVWLFRLEPFLAAGLAIGSAFLALSLVLYAIGMWNVLARTSHQDPTAVRDRGL